MPVNTTASQDRTIREAESASVNHISNLVGIIADLDLQLSDWKAASGCDDPSGLRSKLDLLEASH